MIPLFSQVADHIRITYLGDSEVSGGQIWTNAALLAASSAVGVGPLAGAYETLIRALRAASSERTHRDAYYIVPAKTASVTPANMGLLNMGQPIDIFERAVQHSITNLTTPAINALTFQVAQADQPPQAVVTFNGTHPFLDGQWVQTYNYAGVSDDFNDQFVITKFDNLTILLNGCNATGTWTAGTGVMSDSNEQWPQYPMNINQEIRDYDQALSSTLSTWAFVNGAFRFKPATVPRQIRLIYNLSATCPTSASASVGVDDSLSFLSAYAAALCAQQRGTQEAASRLFTLAVGNPSGDAGPGVGGYLGSLCRSEIKILQQDRFVSPRWRPKRNTGTRILY